MDFVFLPEDKRFCLSQRRDRGLDPDQGWWLYLGNDISTEPFLMGSKLTALCGAYYILPVHRRILSAERHIETNNIP